MYIGSFKTCQKFGRFGLAVRVGGEAESEPAGGAVAEACNLCEPGLVERTADALS